KKNLFFIAVLLILLFSAKTNAQILTPDNSVKEVSEYHIPFSSNLVTDYSSKIVRWREDASVVLNNIGSNYQATFGLLKKGDTLTTITASLPIGYKINDFTILKDTLYFVGNKPDAIDTTKGVIGYVEVGDLFSNSNQSITYAEIRTTKDLFRVEAYKKNNGETVVAAVGRQLYGLPYFVEGPGTGFDPEFPSGPELPLPPNSNIVEPQITGENQVQTNSLNEIGPAWYTDTLKYRHCLATLNITRTTNGVNHQYDLWYLPNVENIEQINDFCLTSDYICIVAVDNTSETWYSGRAFTLHWFDKNNLNIRNAKRLVGAMQTFSYYDNRGNLKTTCVGGNDIALCYIADVGLYCNVLYKLRLDTITVTPIFAHYFADAGQNIKHPVWDLEYIKKFNMLAVLKRSSKYEYVDEVWHLSMNENTMMPYESYVHTKYYDNLSSLELYDGIYLGIYGNVPTRKILFEKQCNEFNSYGNCYDIRKDRVYPELLPKIYNYSVANRCSFADMVQSPLDLLTLPATQTVNVFNTLQINQQNIIKPCENINTDIIYKQPTVIK
ncbi:MAG: hypothetical protein J6V35_04070, partial [Bacteroidales bacterium]|nr:hypothetical protein [Bacteroidales bacterium]